MANSPTNALPSDSAVLTAHFGDPAWTVLLRDRLRLCFPELPDERIYVIDQNRTRSSEAELRRLLPNVRILSFPPSEPHMEATGHDHAHVLNLAVRELPHEYVLLFDSDAHPVEPSVRSLLVPLLAEHDAVLAAKFPVGPESHPCFMAFGPRVPRDRLLFDDDQLTTGADTGRRISEQIVGLGLDAHLLRPEPAFDGVWGTLFLERTIYHHGSGSFEYSAPRLRRQWATWKRRERLARRHVFTGSYELSTTERILQRASRTAAGYRRRAAAALRGAKPAA